ncbi:ribosomal subunit interface protein [bacterium]|nr:ribosomal subunit interface protein [bacterium]|tara:strand:- start:340 stop:702 length:363 start_codon:yes stop_codon:yes gene_type:complete
MHIDFKAPTLELSNDVRNYAEEKVRTLRKLLQKVEDENIRADVELAKKGNQQSGDIFRADITVYAGPDRIHAVGHGESLHAAIDEAKDDLARRLRRDKTRRLDTLREGSAKIKKMLRFWE